jgi:hypothetical protein
MAASYGTRAEADAYFTERGISAWATAPEEARGAALIRGSAYVDGRYRNRFPGRKAGGRAQELEWPRVDAVDVSGEQIAENEVPVEVEYAAYETALRELTAPGSLSPDIIPGSIKKKVRVEGAVEVEYAAGRAKDMMPVLAAVDGLLAPLLSRGAVTTNWVMRA